MKLLIMGDPHIKPSNMSEAEMLLTYSYDVATKTRPDAVIILGDLFHTHLVLRLEVVCFWRYWAEKFARSFKTILLTGNHDQVSDSGREWDMSSLTTLDSTGAVIVYNKPLEWNGVLFVPHTHSESKFLESCNKSDCEILICHQTFDGSQYENGFYAPDGIKQEKIPNNFKYIISGHIHKQQQIGRVWYPGTPKWDSISDANEEKGIWLFDTITGDKTFFSAESVCTPIKSVEIKEGDPIHEFPDNASVLLVLKGSSSWIASVSKKYKNKVKISAKPTDSISNNKYSSALSSIEAYADTFEWNKDINKERVLAIIRGLDV
ncbi:MAG: metallophosphoesterase [Desulfurococcaceae archaeon]